MDKATTISHALDLIGHHDYENSSGTESICAQHFVSVVRECGARHHWAFARKIATLSPNEDGSYSLPIDCLRIKHLYSDHHAHRIPSWQLVGRTLLIDNPPHIVTLLYTADLTVIGAEIPDSAPLFQQYVIHVLASRIAPTICGADQGLNLAQNLLARAESYREQALVIDRQQDGSNDQDLYTRRLKAMRTTI